jgi:hypothetical protein
MDDNATLADPPPAAPDSAPVDLPLLAQHSRAALEEAIALLPGGEAELVVTLRKRFPKLAHGHLYHWRNKALNGVPAEYCVAIADAVGGRVPEWRLRPDVFRPPARPPRQATQ